MLALIEKLNERAHDPKRATDESNDAQDEKGKPAVFVAAPPATEQQVAEAEKSLGFALPVLLRQVYLAVSNGGFGPGYGLLRLPNSEADSQSLVGRYKTLLNAQTGRAWPTGLLPICDWGCEIVSYLDCTRPEALVVRVDPNMKKPEVAERVPVDRHYERAAKVSAACWVEAATLQEWLEAWTDGKRLFYAAYGAVDEEIEEEFEDDGDE